MSEEIVLEATPDGPGRKVWDTAHPACADTRIVDAVNGLVECVPRRKKVAIMGFASSSRDAAPFDDPDYEVWGLNQLYAHLPRRADRWFEVHVPEIFTRDMVRDTNYIGWLEQCPIPVYMVQKYDRVPNAVRYPIERVTAHFDGLKYITSTPSLMVALAIAEGFETIALYGIDLVVGIEYERQKACLEGYLMWHMARGGTVELPKTSALLKARYVYGYEIGPQPGPVNYVSVNDRVGYLTRIREEQLTKLNGIEGALSEIHTGLLPNVPLSDEAKATITTRQTQLVALREQLVTELNQLDGALAEEKNWVLLTLDLYDKGVG